MQPFYILCTTCKARLRVREASALGQILSCPKCSSMVLVDPAAAVSNEPAPEVLAGSVALATAAIPAAKSFDDAAALVDNASTIAPKPVVVTPPVHVPAPPPAPMPVVAAPKPAPVPVIVPAVAPAVSPPVPPVAAAVPPVVPPVRQWLMLAGAALVGVVLAVAAALVWIGVAQREPQPVASVVSPTPTELPPAVEPPPPAATPVVAKSVENPQPAPAPTTPEKSPAFPGPSPDDLALPNPPVAAVEPTPVAAPPIPDKTPAPAAPATSINDGLGEFGRLVQDQPTEPVAPAAPVAEPVDILAEGATQTRPPPRQVDVAARLKDPVASIDFPSISLADWVRFVTEMTTIPLTLEPAAWQQANISPETRIAVKGDKTTVGELLASTLKPLGLKYEVLPGHVRIVRPQPDGGLLRRIKHDVSDLAANDPQFAARTAQLVQQAFAPESWSGRGGQGKIAVEPNALTVEQLDSVHFDILLWCEKTRLARGLPRRSRIQPALIRLEPALQRAQPKLEARVSLTVLRPLRLSQVLARLEQATGARLVVDWAAVEKVGWSTDAAATLAVHNEPLGTALERLLQPLDLTWRAIDDTTLQITTAAALAQHREWAFYPAADLLAGGLTSEQLLERIRRRAGASATVLLDLPSWHLQAFVSPLDQVRVRQALAELNAK